MKQLRACHIDILGSNWFREQSDEQRKQIHQAIQRVQSKNSLEGQPTTNLLEVLLYRKLKLVKRDNNEAAYEKEVALMTYRDNLKPRCIAEKLNISRKRVYKCLDRLKANLKAFLKMTVEQ